MAATQTSGHTSGHSSEVKHVHHGRTLAAWVGTLITSVAFVIGAFGLVFQIWPVFWIAVALVVIAIIATVVLRKMGHGAY